MKIPFIISLSLITFFTSCNSQKNKSARSPNYPEAPNVPETLAHTWLSSKYIRNEYTRLNKDGSVEVFHRSVSGNPYSKGVWEVRDDGFFYWRFTHLLVDGEYKMTQGEFNRIQAKDKKTKKSDEIDIWSKADIWTKLSISLSEDGKVVTFTRHQEPGTFTSMSPKFSWKRVDNP